jgi:predicted phage terminase large subunit-like protein
MERGFWPARHHLHLIDRLEAVARGDIKRLMVFMPPGSAKSTYTSQLFPAWLAAQPPWPGRTSWDILATSNTSTLAEEFSLKVRRHARESSTLLGYKLSDESQAVGRWEIVGRAVYRCAGAGSAIAGQRADVALIDDPIKGSEEADSEGQRAKIWRWYTDDLRQRVKPEGAVIIVQTRWHEDDLSGRILPASWDGESGRIKGRDGEWWEVVCLPQLASRDDDPLGRTDGQALWPEWMPQEACERMRDGMTPRSWSALHQQRPSPDTGGFFDRRWFGRYTFVPQGCRAFLASDWATPEGTDWTVHVVVTVDASNRLYVADVWRGRGTTAESIDAALDLCARHKCSAWLNEKGVLWRTISGQAQARMRERNVFVPNEEYARTQAKDVMARAIQGRWSQGMVMLPEQAPWLADLEHELLRFPAGRHDDQVDALALIGLHLDKVVAPPKQSFGMVKAPEDRMWS